MLLQKGYGIIGKGLYFLFLLMLSKNLQRFVKSTTKYNFIICKRSSICMYSRDLDAMAKMADTEPVYIELLSGYGTSHGPIGSQTKVTLRNEHLSYIITWYTLSAITSYMWFRQFVQKLPLL